MKRFIKYPFALALLSMSAAHNAQAVRYIWFDEPYIDTSWVDEMLDIHRQSVDLFRQRAASYRTFQRGP